MIVPPGRVLTGSRLMVFLTLVSVYQRHGRVTITDLTDRIDMSRSAIHKRLKDLRTLGLVDWTDHARGSLRPLYEVVAHG